MTYELTPDLRRAVHDSNGVEPLRLIDPDTNTLYVLVRADQFQAVAMPAPSEDDLDIKETYRAQFDAAGLSGWNDPAMDDYNNYDESRKKYGRETR